MKNIKNLLPISTNEKGTQVVSMRDLYDWLEAKAEFTTWAKRMFNYGFTKNVDFSVIDKIVKDDTGFGGHRKLKDFALTLDTAKEIAMIQRNERGKQARQYFIETEKQLQNIRNNELPQTPEAQLALTMQVANRTVKRVEKVESDVKKLKEERSLTEPEYSYIAKKVNKNVYSISDEMGLNQEQRSLLFEDINGSILSLTGVKFRTRLQAKHFNDVCELLDNWYPSAKTMVEIRKISSQTHLDV